MVSQNSFIMPSNCSSESYLWLPKKQNNHMSGPTWVFIKHPHQQQREYGKTNRHRIIIIIKKEIVRKNEHIKPTFFNYRLSVPSSIVLF